MLSFLSALEIYDKYEKKEKIIGTLCEMKPIKMLYSVNFYIGIQRWNKVPHL